MICLRTLILQGFKSFAHRTVVEFSSGLNVIVGPNGSGKSNLLEALRFVLGEKAKESKGGHANRVIFHGSSSGKPLGMASVQALWATKMGDGTWSMERRIFASGESEYFWNGKKVRLLDFKEEVRKIGFSLERMGMGVVSHDSLLTVFDFRPAERLRWLEEASGVAELRAKLNVLRLRLEKAREREKRLAERLKEIESQMVRLRGFAQEEEVYLEVEQEVCSLKKCYFDKLRLLNESKINACIEERTRLEHRAAEIASQIDSQRKELLAGRERLDGLRSSVRRWQDEKDSVEQLKRKSEVEIYHIVTRHRESLKMALVLKEKVRVLEHDIIEVEAQVQQWLQESRKWSHRLDVQVAQERLQEKKAQWVRALSLLEEERILLEKKRSQQEVHLAKVVEECRQSEKRKERIALEINQLSQEMLRKKKELRSWKERQEVFSREIQRVQATLQKKRILWQKVTRKLAQVNEGCLSSQNEEMMHRLREMGLPQRALYALSWFFHDKGWYDKKTVHLGELAEKNLGRLMIPVTDCSFSWCSLAEMELILQSDRPLSTHLVASDGSCLVLQGGILVFPLKTVSASRGLNFWKSLQNRKYKLEKAIRSEEEKLKALEKDLQTAERKHWEIGFALEHEEKKIERLQEDYQNLILEIADRSRTKEELQREVEKTLEALLRLNEKRARIRGVLERLERSLQKVQHVILEQEKVEKKRQKLHWEIQVLQDKWQEIQSFFDKEQKTRLFLAENLLAVLPKLREYEKVLTELTVWLERGKRAEKEQGMVVERQEQVIRELEQKKEDLGRRIEKLRREEERLLFEREVLERELRELGDVDVVKDFGLLDISEIEERLREKTAWLKAQVVRRGAIEELQDLKRHYDDLKERDQAIVTLLDKSEKECAWLEREGRRKFREFLRETRDVFGRYFRRIFRDGEIYFLEESNGLDIEVRIPGKKRQPLFLLSSGERALTALCLLLAVFEAAGFPFCFLDEVDANLDHTNSTLFAEMLSEFARAHQVILVTHQGEVMEKAQRIVGVTMNEPGISQVVCVEPSPSGVLEEEKS